MFSNSLMHIFQFHKASQCFLSGRGLLKANRQNRQSIKILKETQKDGNSPPCFHSMHYGFRAMGAVTSRVSELASYFHHIQIFHVWKCQLCEKHPFTISLILIFGSRFFWFLLRVCIDLRVVHFSGKAPRLAPAQLIAEQFCFMQPRCVAQLDITRPHQRKVLCEASMIFLQGTQGVKPVNMCRHHYLELTLVPTKTHSQGVVDDILLFHLNRTRLR